jgi:ABC-type nickel/cobalt efflux system permease component RcnA
MAVKPTRALTILTLGGLAAFAAALAPGQARAHPMGNFSISHYAALRILPGGIELRYLLDLAEIPTFQEIQAAGIAADADHPGVPPYLAGKAATLATALVVELDGRRVELETVARELRVTPGAGGLPTMKLGVVYRAAMENGAGVRRLTYRDENFPDRAGWKEIVATGGPGIVLTSSSVPDRDRSRELSDYPTDLLDSPPQRLDASIAFTSVPAPPAVAGRAPSPPASVRPRAGTSAATVVGPAAVVPPAGVAPGALALEPNRGAPQRDAFADLIATPETSVGVVLFAALVAAMLGAVHALEPGHGKTVVAAYLVGSRGTASHALLLGLIVTASHTAGVYLLGGVTLYASRYVVPERLYPWVGACSGLIIAGLGVVLFLKRYRGASVVRHGHPHAHPGEHGHTHSHPHGGDHGHADGAVSLRALCALGVSGGIVPCPAALVVLLSAVALRRIGFGLVLIVAFSLGLAAVLVGIGLLMVHARRLMARVHGDGALVTRWLPLTSSAAIIGLGVAIAAQALVAGGIVQIRLG